MRPTLFAEDIHPEDHIGVDSKRRTKIKDEPLGGIDWDELE